MSRVASVVVRSVVLSLVSLASLGAIGVAGALAGTDVGSINFTLGYKNLAGEWNLNAREVDVLGQPLPADRTYYPSLGIEGTWGHKSWPVQIAFDVLNSADDGITHVPQFFTQPAYDVRLRAHVIEVGLGVRRAFDLKIITPYIGAGGLWSRGEATIEVNDPNTGQFGTPIARAHTDRGSPGVLGGAEAFGYWIGGGITRRLGPRFQMGLAYRLSKNNLPAMPFIVDSGTLPFGNGSATFPEADAGGKTINLVVGWSFPSR